MMEARPSSAPTLPVITVPCPCCEGTSYRILFHATDILHGKPGSFGVVRCTRCGTQYTNPRPAPESMLSYYPDDYAPYQTLAPPERQSSSALRRIVGRMYHALMHSADVLDGLCRTGERLLDIGCSTGTYLQSQRRWGAELVGVEFSEKPAAYARDVLGLNVFHGELEAAGFADESFHAVTAWMVLEHVPSPRATLREIHRILRPGGTFAFSVPNAGSWEFRVFRSHWFALQVPTHLTHFSRATIREMLAREGFSVERIVDQRNVDSIVASTGYVFRAVPGLKTLGAAWARFPNMNGPVARFIVRPLLQPIAWLLALVRQGGRITVRARRNG